MTNVRRAIKSAGLIPCKGAQMGATHSVYPVTRKDAQRGGKRLVTNLVLGNAEMELARFDYVGSRLALINRAMDRVLADVNHEAEMADD